MDRRGFFASVLALVAARKFRRNLPPGLSPVPAPVKRFAPAAPSVFSGDWTIHGARYHCATYAVMIPIDPRLLEGAKWVVPHHRENIR
jgi:hypothetical protein